MKSMFFYYAGVPRYQKSVTISRIRNRKNGLTQSRDKISVIIQ